MWWKAVAAGVFGAALATAADACGPPVVEWTKASASGDYELTVSPTFEGLGLRVTYRLDRIRPGRTTVWQVESSEYHRDALIADDGDYVITSGGGWGMTIRNSAGATIRSLVNWDLVSIFAQLSGHTWQLGALDASQEYLLLEITVFGDDYEPVRSTSRRVQLMDGAVVDRPATPDGFALPKLECGGEEKGTISTRAGRLTLGCLDFEAEREVFDEYAYSAGEFRRIAVDQWGPEYRHEWRAADPADASSQPCESVVRSSRLVSERCGADVLPPGLSAPTSSSPSSSRASSLWPSLSPPSSSHSSSPASFP